MKKFNERVADILTRGREMEAALITPILDQSTGGIIADRKERNARLEAVTGNSVFESAGKGGATIQGVAANAVAGYFARHGEMPGYDLLASAHMSIDNFLSARKEDLPREVQGIFEAATSTTEGILLRDRMVALVLPILLNSITSRMVTHIPGTFNQSEIFRVRRIAGSTFGDLTSGDVIGYDFNGQYSSMDQRYQAGTGDGTVTGSADEFEFDSATDIGTAMPFKRKSVKILHDRTIVAQDNGDGNLFGSFLVGATTVNVTGTVNYNTGNINPVFSVAPANGIEIHVGFDVDIEKNADLIPLIDHQMDSKTVYPHETALGALNTLQALYAFRREYNLDLENLAMTGLRDFVSGERDRKILNDMIFYALGSTSWVRTVPTAQYFQEHYETLRQTLLVIDAALLARTGVAGLSGVVFDKDSASLIKSMKDPNYVPPPNYKRSAQPHYIGRIFGMWDAYENPQATSWTNLCFANGKTVGESGYVVGDCVPTVPIVHPTLRDLNKAKTLWGLGYREIHPFDGRNYFMKLQFTT